MNARMVRESMTSLREKESQVDSQGTTSGTLTQLRSLIGNIQISHTYTPIQSFVSVDFKNNLLMTTIGLAAIVSAFEEASMFFVYTNGYFGTKKVKVASQALAFIQGTSLEICIKTYGIEYDANEQRQVFFRTFHVKS